VPDVVGIGAINLDYIVDTHSATSLQEGDGGLRPQKFEHGVERRASEDDIRYALSYLSRANPRISPGGAALNVIASIGSTSAPLSVGYVGICGPSLTGEFEFGDWFSVVGIDSSMVGRAEVPAGVCVSYTKAGERSMLTWGGANEGLEDHLSNRYEEILAYLSSARIVHITALASQKEPAVLAKLVTELKQRHPSVAVSVDPGALWSPLDRPPAVSTLLATADVIFANSDEFDLLSRRFPNMSDRDAAAQSFRILPTLRALLVLKRYDLVKVFFALGDDTVERIYHNGSILDANVIVDDTGAGDAFAAGFLVGQSLPGLEISDGVELGMRLARRKLQYVGTTGAAHYRQEFIGFSADLVARSRVSDEESHKKRVFVGHGRNAEWLHVRDCLAHWGLVPTYYGSTPSTGKFTSDILTTQALGADFAVIVATADDTDGSGRPSGRQNVVHEIGLMQGRLGWSKVAILLEEGVEPFSNIAGLQHIRFATGRINQAFHELEEMLVREGLLHPPAAQFGRF
jgi:sugar/nucleoside kinase (ribokinase family)